MHAPVSVRTPCSTSEKPRVRELLPNSVGASAEMPELPDHRAVEAPELHRQPVLDATNTTIYTNQLQHSLSPTPRYSTVRGKSSHDMSSSPGAFHLNVHTGYLQTIPDKVLAHAVFSCDLRLGHAPSSRGNQCVTREQ